MINQNLIEFVQEMPKISEELRNSILYALDLLEDLEVRVDGIRYSGDGFDLQLPLFQTLFGQYEIPMHFCIHSYLDEDANENVVSCGPSTLSATKECIKGYIDWLDKYMPRRGETLRDVLEAGNPDNLILPDVK